MIRIYHNVGGTGGGVEEAPIDGSAYARKDGAWVVTGGVSYLNGTVEYHADLPVTVGTPIVNSAYLVRKSSGLWLPFYDTRKPAGIWVRELNNGDLDDWVYAGIFQDTQNDENFTIYDGTDTTKELAFSVGGITTGTRRVLTVQDANGTIALTGDAPTAHKTSHENGGGDEISVAGLSGVLADPQPPIIGAGAGDAVAGNDSRLTNERVPTAAGLTTKFGTNKATVVDGDKIGMLNSAASDVPVHILWSLVKSTLKTYFDTLYTTAAAAIAAVKAGFVLDENASIGLDPAGSADGKYSGITVTGVSGYSQAFGDLVTLDKDDSRWEAVDISVAAAATGDARGIIGIVVVAGTDGNACTILLHGIIRADANFPTLTIGAPVYASTTGDVVVAQPTTTDYVIRVIGHGLTADELYFNPDNAYITHT